MDAFEQLLATLDGSIASLDTMIQNADASDKKDDVKNEDKKDEQIANLTAKIANLESRLKNAEGKEDDESIKNLASRMPISGRRRMAASRRTSMLSGFCRSRKNCFVC